VKYPEGSGGAKKKHLHLDKENFKKKKKQAIVQIVNPWDSLCLPRAIVFTRLHALKPEVPDPEWEEKWKRMRLGDVRALDQKRQALALMEEAGCDTTQPCGLEEWRTLQHVLAPEIRLKIFQFKVNTRRLQLEPLYKGWRHGTCLNVFFDNSARNGCPRNYSKDMPAAGTSIVKSVRKSCLPRIIVSFKSSPPRRRTKI
jgi:hypothetical protein